ncbi:REP-associated tyrosine transposase [Blastopirellula retiformator]|uniref:Transposase IS200 like protein n=1 Tax=Blastopirellula retiformator TaxID=2527970 RepID=A0A5C5V4D7_9BACT|nr:transposase [Blastopirellula retiformator]TWT32930.1 Transposase IS200 like protein [Blastopirellula retiformator]
MAHRRRIADDERFCHFLTFGCDARRNLLELEQPCRILLGQLNAQLLKYSAKCVGYVIMPNHVHALIWLPETGRLSSFIQDWKRQSSFQIRSWYAEQNVQYLKESGSIDRLWTPRFYSFPIYSQEKLIEKLGYMHQNPVRAGLVERIVDWKFSSARWYELRKSVGVPIEWIF